MRLFTTFLFSTFMTVMMFAQTVNIEGDPYGNNPYPSIDSALTDANKGDVILITGLHTGRLTIGKAITLRGSNPMTDIIEGADTIGTATGRTINVTGVGSDSISFENLTIRHGNANGGNGGGIFFDHVTGLASLTNVIVEDNMTSKQGGGIGVGASNVNITDCTIRNNSATSATSDGGGIHMVSQNGSGSNFTVNVWNTIIHHNHAGRNGGAFTINGNNNFGDQYIATVNFENTTMAFNDAANFGGSGHVWGVDIVAGGGNTVGETNVHCTMKHVTIGRNTATAGDKFGLYFTNGNATTGPKFDIYNSIAVSAGLLGNRGINFQNSSTGDVINCIIGGQLGIATVGNNVNTTVGQTAGQAGIADSLSDEGGPTLLLAIASGSAPIDHCTASTAVSVPSDDARGYMRDATPDAGAMEFIINAAPTVASAIADQVFTEGFGSSMVDLSSTFSDPDGNTLSVSAMSADMGIATVSISNNSLTIMEVDTGMTEVIVTADDGFGGIAMDTFMVTINPFVNSPPVVANALADQMLTQGFGTIKIDLSSTFSDADGHPLTLMVSNSFDTVATAMIANDTLTITEVDTGMTTMIVSANDENGGSVSDTFHVTIELSTSIDRQVLEGVEIFPNPSHDGQLTVRFAQAIKQGSIQVFTLSGKMVSQRAAQFAQEELIDLSAFSRGLYVIKVEDHLLGKHAIMKVMIK
ncbi:MAG: T9SS type A sorting domain-containing protein [Bacteroidota bacterium]